MSRLFVKRLPTGSFLMLLLYIGLLLSAIAVAYSTYWNRQLLNSLYSELSVRDKAQAEWGRLILEQSTWTAHSRIESLAVEQLRMRVPDPAEVGWWRHETELFPRRPLPMAVLRDRRPATGDGRRHRLANRRPARDRP